MSNTTEARAEARATITFRPVDYDRVKKDDNGLGSEPQLSVYIVRQGPFKLGHLLRYPAGNFGFMIDGQLHERLLLEREYAHTPFNLYKETLVNKETGFPLTFETEPAIRAAVAAFRDALFAWTLDVLVPTTDKAEQ